MRKILFVYLLSLLFLGCKEKGKGSEMVGNQVIKEQTTRTVENNLITSDSLPDIKIQLSSEFEYVGKFDFEIIANSEEYGPEILGKAVASGERMVFVNSDSTGVVNKLFVVQFEGFLPQNDLIYNYNFDKAAFIGQNKYRHNTWFYDSNQLALENPENEGAKTRKFLQDKGYSLEDEFMMSRFVGLASSDRKHEIIMYYIEMLHKNTGYSLAELERSDNKEAMKRIRNELIDRSKKSFIIVKG